MVVRHAFTVDEWHRMGEAGLFGEDARVELLDGEVMELSPIGSRHGGTVNRLTRMLVNAAGVRAVVAIQNPVILDARSEPQPDVAVLAPRADDYIERHAGPDEILLLIEVADSSLVSTATGKPRSTAARGFGSAGSSTWPPEWWR